MEKGQIVRSIAGRDKGTLFVVLDCDNIYAYVADGKTRKVEKPKKKKLKHLQISKFISDVVTNEVIENYMVRKALTDYSEK